MDEWQKHARLAPAPPPGRVEHAVPAPPIVLPVPAPMKLKPVHMQLAFPPAIDEQHPSVDI
jgi:hypothetical protein